ncbi:hypothetical protein SAMN04488025_13132 [Planifilum fulgidum]|uniref:Methyl-accepting chemotaxis protein n=1 Tax=Planifilum fulgidum TaxID=201973 RepID=A0A1I2RJ64_9BACL|nr:hypothetical protein [Planifilum fulgidum]SFG40598.1 hypothetical protein SAMN04488025_13132 [Planifilum fulgidum]
MIRKTLSIVALLLLSGFLINGITMTQNLKRLHAGLESNLESVKTLNQVQSSIIDKNGKLSKMLSTMDRADKGLDDAIGKTDQLLTLLSKVVDYNADTLRLNDQMLKHSSASKRDIQSISQNLAELDPYMKQMDEMLKNLASTAKEDEKYLKEILDSTRHMNSKLPGVNTR